jgi:mediator of RNA polymerase II transcription subunit 10
VVEYVQEGRNPDIYTREFVELAMRNNQRLRGKMDACGRFRDIFAREIAGAVPALRKDVEAVVVHTGGEVAILDGDKVQVKIEEG